MNLNKQSRPVESSTGRLLNIDGTQPHRYRMRSACSKLVTSCKSTPQRRLSGPIVMASPNSNAGVSRPQAHTPEKLKATSWSGTETKRREQGSCKPPAHDKPTVNRFSEPIDGPARYEIDAGSECEISQAGGSWHWYVTKKPLSFNRYESAKYGCAIFRYEDWHIKIKRRLVRQNF